ncbi:MAG: acetyl-CoA C-acyltransferase [Flavobacteriales bacterium]|jgi:3-oxoadipyl-CoA thiolase|nr:acetyl-CoA C-acyltransferase [Flavobacteriales bacterium]MBT3962663.1 acetyl-CoA C-acyltransferase [Flavobacteriales bacterium]MBT4705059.1 acetyl-CoA C-acyltransferase [Flavobacteriales bacterium]MBT4930079.1 acetyl-CoA C-acyltransferase [Flavobacteriales bacterium]MBT5133037.1 acetyl-CoA C-acyltransferase [Flavobacteriales bacterium]
MREAFIVDAIRTPIGKFQGALSPVRTDDLAALVIKELMARNSSVDWEAVDDVILGCANQAGEDNRNVARMALLLAGMPWKVPGETINRLCSSGMSAAVHARRAIAANEGDLFVTGGVENMTRGPWVMSKASKPYGNDSKLYDSSFGWRFVNKKMHELYGTDAMGETAENLVDKFNVSREDQDAFAYWSQMKATKAQESGRLSEEIVAVEIPRRKQDALVFDKDEFVKPTTTKDILAGLRPAFRKEGGSVTAGNASGLNDGAGAMLVASEDGLKAHNLTPMARIVSSGVSGVEPRIMGIGPVFASQLALKRAGLAMGDMDILEFNEAFAVQTLACTRELGVADDDPRINPNGGAIAIGHPLGMTGSRILQTAAIELHKQNKKYALVAMCIGVGQGYATIIERV